MLRQARRKKIEFSEDEIRPDGLKIDMAKAVLADVKRLNSRRKYFVFVNCPACGLSKCSLKFKKYGMNISECSKCNTFYTNPRPTADILGWFYKYSVNYDYWNQYTFPASEKARRKKIFVPRVNMVLQLCDKFAVKNGSLLEIGAGYGTFCQEMISRKIFKEVVAIEPSENLAKTCVAKGIKTINSNVESVRFKRGGLFDVMVNFEVIEHLFSPKNFLLSCKRLLKKGGLFIFTLPNGAGFDISVLGKLSASIDHEHLNYFNPESMKLFLERCGFKTLEIVTPGKLDAELVRKKIISGEFDVSNQVFLRKVLIDNWEECGSDFQKFISEHELSSHMMVTAQKI